MPKPLNDLIKQIEKFREERDWKQFHDAKNLSMALSAEVGELQEILMWAKSDEIQGVIVNKKDKFREELADVGIYLLLLCQETGLDLLEIIEAKIAHNEAKYPVSKAKGVSKKYNEL